MRYRTLREIDEAGHDIRVWCFKCGRGHTFDGHIWRSFEAKGWTIALQDATRHFRCKRCGVYAQKLLIPRTRRPRWIDPNAGAHVIAGYYHLLRSSAKKARERW